MLKKILLIPVLMLVFVSLGFADGYLSSVTTSTSVSKVTTGTNFQINAVITAGSEQVTASSIQVVSAGSNTGSSFTISDPPDGSYSNTAISTSGTTKTFTATAGVADTYTYYVTAAYSSGSKSSTNAIIEFISPSALTVSGTPASAGSKSAGQSYTLSVNIQNPGSSDVTTSYVLSCPSGTTCTGDPSSSSGTTIAAGTTKNLQWTVTIDTSFSGTKDVTLQVGDNTAAFTSTITGTVTTTTTTTASSGGGGGGSSSNVTTTTLGATTTTTIAGATTTTMPGETTTTTIAGAEEGATTTLISPGTSAFLNEYWWYILFVVMFVVVVLAIWYYHPHLLRDNKTKKLKQIRQEIKQVKKEVRK